MINVLKNVAVKAFADRANLPGLQHQTSSTAAREYPRIAIVGGGVCGLSLLATLTRLSIPATLYERDASFEARAGMGGMLDLHWPTGQRCLRENGLEDVARKYLRFEAEETRIYRGNGNGELLHHDIDPAATPELSKPEIDRGDLIRLLLNACRQQDVCWGRGLQSARPLGQLDEGGPIELTFADGSRVECDLLVGADGAFSRVRPLLSDISPRYAGVNGFELSIAAAVVSAPDHFDLFARLGRGSAFSLADGKILACQRNGDGRIRIYAWTNMPAEWDPPSEPEQALRFLRDLYVGWQPWMLQLFDLCDKHAIYPRPLFQLPVGFAWGHRRSITLIGDAAHVMVPFAGVGANLAMLDGLELGTAIAKAVGEGGHEALDKALVDFETEMLRRAGASAQMAVANQQRMLCPDNADATVAKMLAFQHDRVQKL